MMDGVAQRILTTRRLVLRPVADHDIEPIYRACQDADIQRYTLVPVPYRRSDAEHFVYVVAPAPSSVTFAIDTINGSFVGIIGVTLQESNRGTVGFWCAPTKRERGYLGEALRAVVGYAFDESSHGGLGLNGLTWDALCGNIASARTAASAGFRYIGRRSVSPAAAPRS